MFSTTSFGNAARTVALLSALAACGGSESGTGTDAADAADAPGNDSVGRDGPEAPVADARAADARVADTRVADAADDGAAPPGAPVGDTRSEDAPFDGLGCPGSCAQVKNATNVRCENGACTYSRCTGAESRPQLLPDGTWNSFLDCDGDRSNGCETQRSPTRCTCVRTCNAPDMCQWDQSDDSWKCD